MKKILSVTGAASALFLLGGIAALAAPNPSGTDQPSAECGSDTALMSPAGFTADGFANAESHYAGSDGTASAEHAQSSHAVSQYDVACYQVSQ
jgi:hypothetical protein